MKILEQGCDLFKEKLEEEVFLGKYLGSNVKVSLCD